MRRHGTPLVEMCALERPRARPESTGRFQLSLTNLFSDSPPVPAWTLKVLPPAVSTAHLTNPATAPSLSHSFQPTRRCSRRAGLGPKKVPAEPRPKRSGRGNDVVCSEPTARVGHQHSVPRPLPWPLLPHAEEASVLCENFRRLFSMDYSPNTADVAVRNRMLVRNQRVRS